MGRRQPAYLLADDRLTQLTVDHNEAGELVRRGAITKKEARKHPGQRLLTRALGCGARKPPTVDVVSVPARGRLLLCTDGLHGELSEGRIASLLAGGTPAEAADRLVEAALAAGGHDNVTVVAVDLPKTDGPVRVAASARSGVENEIAVAVARQDWRQAVLACRRQDVVPLKQLAGMARACDPSVTRPQVRALLESAGYLEPLQARPKKATSPKGGAKKQACANAAKAKGKAAPKKKQTVHGLAKPSALHVSPVHHKPPKELFASSACPACGVMPQGLNGLCHCSA